MHVFIKDVDANGAGETDVSVAKSACYTSRVPFQVPTPSGSEPPETPVPGDLIPASDLCEDPHTHVHRHTHTHRHSALGHAHTM